jgi:hypothetical protein
MTSCLLPAPTTEDFAAATMTDAEIVAALEGIPAADIGEINQIASAPEYATGAWNNGWNYTYSTGTGTYPMVTSNTSGTITLTCYGGGSGGGYTSNYNPPGCVPPAPPPSNSTFGTP